MSTKIHAQRSWTDEEIDELNAIIQTLRNDPIPTNEIDWMDDPDVNTSPDYLDPAVLRPRPTFNGQWP